MNKMDANQTASFLAFVLGAALLVCILSLVRNYQLDKIRDELFSLRDAMFLYAVDNDLVDSPSYRHLRLMMNGMIRHAHKLTVYRFVVLVLGKHLYGLSGAPTTLNAEWKAATDALPQKKREMMQGFHSAEMYLIVHYMVWRSLPMSIGFGGALLLSKLWKSSNDSPLGRAVRRMPLGLIEVDAMTESGVGC
jgi:hypothetical protein